MNMDMEQARFNMIEQQIRPWEVLDPVVLDLLSEVKREEFVPAEQKLLAFADVCLPLGSGAAMLEPKMEARLLQELGLKSTDRVLEIGAGSGYMAALLAARAEFVTSLEIEPALVAMARANLARAGIANVAVEQADGLKGWTAKAPYDAIVISGSVPVRSSRPVRSVNAWWVRRNSPRESLTNGVPAFSARWSGS